MISVMISQSLGMLTLLSSLSNFGGGIHLAFGCSFVSNYFGVDTPFWWNPDRTSWESYQLDYCGKFCEKDGNNKNVKFIAGYNYPPCPKPQCYPCDCADDCHLYGTCCPWLDNDGNISSWSKYLHDVNALFEGREEVDFRLKSHVPPVKPPPESFSSTFSSSSQPPPSSLSTLSLLASLLGKYKCIHPPDTDPFSKDLYFMVSECPSPKLTINEGDLFNILSSSSFNGINVPEDTIRRCEHSERDSFDDITPFSNMETAITFKNYHCALCNGFDVAADIDEIEDGVERDNASETETYNQQLSVQNNTVHPWELKIICVHYQHFIEITDAFDFYIRTTDSFPQCNTSFQSHGFVDEKIQPKLCPPSWSHSTNLVGNSCEFKRPLNMYSSSTTNRSNSNTISRPDNPHWTLMCHGLKALPALEVEGYKNIFCALCNGVLPIRRIVPPDVHAFPGDTIHEISIEQSLVEKIGPWTPPIFLLFGASTRRSKMMSYPMSSPKCESDVQWRNDQVSN